MNYMSKATTHSETSILKWSKQNKWIARATDYDNVRADQIMSQDVSVVTQYQRSVTEAALEDMQMLRAAWQKTFERIAGYDGLTVTQQLDAIKSLADSRMKIENLARIGAKMPDKYRAQTVEVTEESDPQDFIQLTLAGPRSVEIEDGKFSQPEKEKTPEQLSSEIISPSPETARD